MRISPTPSCALFRTVLFVVFLLAPAAWLESQAVPLKATINHTEKMPAVDPLLKPGAQFSLSATEEEPQNFWLRIPDWLAGTWQSDNETRVYNEDFRAGKTDSEVVPFKAKSRFTYGQQTDRQGGIWHYLGIPYCSATDFPNYTEYHQKGMSGNYRHAHLAAYALHSHSCKQNYSQGFRDNAAGEYHNVRPRCA
jgi:hypothetical protein